MVQIDNTITKPENKRLIRENRVLIEYMLKTGLRQVNIAEELGVHRSIIPERLSAEQ